MKQFISKLRVGLTIAALLVGITAVPLVASTVAFADAKSDLCEGANLGTTCNTGTNKTVPQIIQNVINTLIFITGAVSVIFIVVGGLKYVLSGGDQSQVTAAKNTILYAVVGLVVAIAAYGIVAFVVTQFA